MLVTTCPGCQTTFKVTVAILEKAGGQVRCGRCTHVFDANLSLREHAATETQDIARIADTLSATGTRWILHDEPPTDVAPTGHDPDATAGIPPKRKAAEPPDPVTAAKAQAVPPQESEPPSARKPAPRSAAAPESAPESDSLPEPGSESVPAGAGPAGPGAMPPTDAEDEFTKLLNWLPLDSVTPRRRRTWAAGSALAGLLLAVQIIHFARSSIAGMPAIGPALVAIYNGLGMPLAAPVDLKQYSTLDLTAVAEPATEDHGWLIIETRVQNRGPAVQPFPHIFVGLLDRWQETIAGRYFRPDEYLVTPVSDTSRMNTGSTVDAQFVIVDPGPAATGFELKLCVPVGTSYRCDTE